MKVNIEITNCLGRLLVLSEVKKKKICHQFFFSHQIGRIGGIRLSFAKLSTHLRDNLLFRLKNT